MVVPCFPRKAVSYVLVFLIVCINSQRVYSQDSLHVSQFKNLEIVDSKGQLVDFNSKAAPEESYLLSFDLINERNSDHTYQLFTGKNQQAILKLGGKTYKGGKYTPSSERVYQKHFYFIPISVTANDTLHLELVIQNSVGFSGNRKWLENDIFKPNWKELVLFSEKGYLQKTAEVTAGDNFYNILINIFLGAIGFTAIFVLLLYLLNRQLSFFYYSAYLLCFFVFGIFHTRQYSFIGLKLSEYPVFHQLFPESIIWVGMFFYGYFSIHLLKITKEKYPKIRLFIVCISWFSLVAGLFMALPLLWTNNLKLNLDLVQWMRYLYSPLGFIGMILFLWKVESKLKYLLVAGVGMWALLGNYSSSYAIQDGYQLTSVGLGSNDAILWTCTGLLLESIMFSFALGVQIRNTEKERLKNKESLIEKMGELQILKEEENLELERKVEEKTAELIRAYELVEAQNKRELEQRYEKRLAISEMDALRSQMNPHFIFNSLSSIKHLLLSNEKEKSSAYLSKFAKLLRQILTFSRRDSISLYEELENMKIYLELESQRFSDQFVFSIDVDDIPKYKLEDVAIPSLLLQPFVENALLHGLKNSSKKTKKIDISVKHLEEQLQVRIFDNGIGREAAMRFKRGHSESLGTQITAERIALFNETYQTEITIETNDLADGTEVLILI